ncbi:hypothetical protein EMCRGX_G023379 [Ephydatia muelleri]
MHAYRDRVELISKLKEERNHLLMKYICCIHQACFNCGEQELISLHMKQQKMKDLIQLHSIWKFMSVALDNLTITISLKLME